MTDDYKSSAPTAQLGGAKQKNGHKAHCTCHICENIKNKTKRGGYEEDAEKEQIKRMGGSKKKNGHKPNCGCPICKNMKNAKKGGYPKEESEGEYNEIDKNDSNITGGKSGKKSNGHKANCQCPICKNMKKKTRKGGEHEPDIENQLGDIEEGMVKGEKTETMDVKTKETPATDQEYDELDALEKGMAGPGAIGGGTRKRRRSNCNKSNCNKSNCRCPICKNIKRKTRRHRKRSHRRR
jgi:hypothetical protein